MKFNCEFFDGEDEIREIIVTLDAGQCEAVERIRERDGDEQALLIARCYALRAAYADVDPHQFSHTAPPQRVHMQ
jgi:hypothetical protein